MSTEEVEKLNVDQGMKKVNYTLSDNQVSMLINNAKPPKAKRKVSPSQLKSLAKARDARRKKALRRQIEAEKGYKSPPVDRMDISTSTVKKRPRLETGVMEAAPSKKKKKTKSTGWSSTYAKLNKTGWLTEGITAGALAASVGLALFARSRSSKKEVNELDGMRAPWSHGLASALEK